MSHLHILFITVISGLIAVLFDLIIRQIVLSPLIEKNIIPNECKKFRGTKEHIITTFLLGCFLFLIIRYTYLKNITK